MRITIVFILKCNGNNDKSGRVVPFELHYSIFINVFIFGTSSWTPILIISTSKRPFMEIIYNLATPSMFHRLVASVITWEPIGDAKSGPTWDTWNPNQHFNKMLWISVHTQGQDVFIYSWCLLSGPSPFTVLPTQCRGR